jgi:hypothetical protein
MAQIDGGLDIDAELLAAIAASEAQEGEASAARIRSGMEAFKGVVGVGGRTAEYYVAFAFSHGLTVDDAVARYFDHSCAEPPQDFVSSLPD